MSKEQMDKYYGPCRQCIAMDVSLQQELVETKRKQYLDNLEKMCRTELISENDSRELKSNCEACYQLRKTQSDLAKGIRSGFEKMDIQDPFKGEQK